MSVYLEPIAACEYDEWFKRSTADYAKDKVHAKQWAHEGALERAQEDTRRFLPQGIETKGHSLCHVLCSNDDARVGTIWWSVSERFGRKIAFIFDVYIYAHARRRGYAKDTLKYLEHKVRKENVEVLSLHVFAFNTGAYKLYEQLGYAPTSITMTRELQ